MRNVIKYLFCTSWKTKQADWGDYSVLRGKLTQARDEKNQAVDRITCNFGFVGDDDKEKKERMLRSRSCIRRYMMTSSVSDMNMGATSEQMVPMRDDCPIFGEKWCQNYNCPMVYNNHRFRQACEKYEKLQKLCRQFWENRFANVK